MSQNKHFNHKEKQPAGPVNGKPALPAVPESNGVTIYINRTPYRTANAEFSGADLRSLSNPPIGPDQDIFRVVSGKGDDIKLSDTDVIAVNMRAQQGRHFFSDTIVPSKDALARRAYAIYLEEGSQPGHDAENWSKAEAELDTRSKK
jgi:hypothetical protein